MFHTAQCTWQQNFFPAELPTPSNASNEIWDQTWDLKKKKKLSKTLIGLALRQKYIIFNHLLNPNRGGEIYKYINKCTDHQLNTHSAVMELFYNPT